MNNEQIKAVESLPVGTVINGKHGKWTLMGTPRYSHPSTFDGTPVFRATALWQGAGGQKMVVVTFDRKDVL